MGETLAHSENFGGIIHHLYSNEMFHDVQIIVEGEVFFAHKIFLYSRSSVLGELVFLPETSSNTAIVLEGVKSSSFRNVLTYIYKSQVHFTSEFDAFDTHAAAVKYKMKDLLMLCQKYFDSLNITPETACHYLDLSLDMNYKRLEERCIKIIREKTGDVLNSHSFNQTTAVCIEKILRLDKVSVTRFELLIKIISWAEQRENCQDSIRSILDPLLPLMKFTQLLPEKFCAIVMEHVKLFEPKEALGILMNILLPGSYELPSWYK